jgi:hypothetical protein
METAAPRTMVTVVRLMSAPEVPTEQSMTDVVPSDLNNLAQVAVPEAFAETSGPMEFATAIPPEAVPKAVLAKVNSASSTWDVMAVSPVAGCVPS